jgi:hypothetical protein
MDYDDEEMALREQTDSELKQAVSFLMSKVLDCIEIEHDQTRRVNELVIELNAKARELCEEWSNLKNSFKIPKRQQIEERREHERQLSSHSATSSSSSSSSSETTAASSLHGMYMHIAEQTNLYLNNAYFNIRSTRLTNPKKIFHSNDVLRGFFKVWSFKIIFSNKTCLLKKKTISAKYRG